MIASYLVRLFCLCLASFFLAYTVISLGIALATPAALRLAAQIRPRLAARLLFILRVSPAAFGAFFVLAVCMPSYLWREPELTAERVSLLCLAMAALGLVICGAGFRRASEGISRSLRFARSCQHGGREVRWPKESEPLLVIDDPAPIFALSGIGSRSRLIVSRNLLRALSAKELSAALRHEQGHRVSRDNLKRLAFLLSPGVFPFSARFAAIESSWAKFAEWAADDYSAGGDPGCALSLASALVRAAKMGAPREPAPLLNSLIVNDSGLAGRVDRLLFPVSHQGWPRRWKRSAIGSAFLLAGLALLTLVLWPAILSLAYQPLEYLIR